MKSAHIAVIGFLAMAVMIPMAKAQTSTFTFAQTAKPVLPSYPGVNANILGLRIGMTLSQAEVTGALIPGGVVFGPRSGTAELTSDLDHLIGARHSLQMTSAGQRESLISLKRLNMLFRLQKG